MVWNETASQAWGIEYLHRQYPDTSVDDVLTTLRKLFSAGMAEAEQLDNIELNRWEETTMLPQLFIAV